MRHVVSVLEAIGLIEAVGDEVLSAEECLWAQGAAQRRGCRFKTNALSALDRERLLDLGERCWMARKRKA